VVGKDLLVCKRRWEAIVVGFIVLNATTLKLLVFYAWFAETRIPVTGFPLGCCCDHSYSAWTTISDRGDLPHTIIGLYSCAPMLMNLLQAFPLLMFWEAIARLVVKCIAEWPPKTTPLRYYWEVAESATSSDYRCVCFGSFLALSGSAFEFVSYFSPRKKVTYGNYSPLLHPSY
jgi:hypothetical protein